MQTNFTYYDILGVQEQATPEEIRAAYHSAVRKYHPDVNSAPNAQKLTAILNEAYAVLSDPGRKASYDASLRTGASAQEPTDEQQALWDLYACDRCGQFSPHLRFAKFFKVWSILIYTRMQGEGGVLCPDCRSKVAMETAVFSAFLGPWGFPWGIIYTLRALIASIRGGELPQQLNAELLRHQGIALLQRNEINLSRTALNASQWFEKNQSVSDLLNDSSVFGASNVIPVPRMLKGQYASIALLLVVPILLLVVFAAFGSSSTNTSDTSSTSSSTSQTVQTDTSTQSADQPDSQQRWGKEKQIFTKCDSVSDKNATKDGYQACIDVGRMLSEDIKADDPGSEQQQMDLYYSDLARIHQSNAIRILGLDGNPDALDKLTSSDLKHLMQDGVTDNIKSRAQKVYDCYFDNNCRK